MYYYLNIPTTPELADAYLKWAYSANVDINHIFHNDARFKQYVTSEHPSVEEPLMVACSRWFGGRIWVGVFWRNDLDNRDVQNLNFEDYYSVISNNKESIF